MAYVVGPKGHVVIAKEIRNRLGVEPGWVVLQCVVGDHVEVYVVAPEHRRSLKGSLAKHLKVPVPPGEWDKARDTAWSQAAHEKVGPGERAP